MNDFQRKIRFAAVADKPFLKALWQTCFDDSDADIERFFSTAYSDTDCIVSEIDGAVRSMLFLLECDISVRGTPHFSYYVYAVGASPEYRHRGLMSDMFSFAKEAARERGADYLFLVPENDSLYQAYEKLGFAANIFYYEKAVLRGNATPYDNEPFTGTLSFNDYKRIVLSSAERSNPVVWRSDAFKYINSSKAVDGCCIHIKDSYCYYEKTCNTLNVLELYGDFERLISVLFYKEPEAEIVCLRLQDGLPCDKRTLGMSFALNGLLPKSVSFGLPYG